MARLEHANVTVSDPASTAAWMRNVFNWTIRWQGDAIADGHTIHVGGPDTYLALYRPAKPAHAGTSSYDTVGGLNHVGVVVDDLDATEARVRKAGFLPKSHADYEPGRRFYFEDDNGIEFEVVNYDDKSV